MQRRYSEPNTYIDTMPSNPHNTDELYDDVAFTADPEVCSGIEKLQWSKQLASGPQLSVPPQPATLLTSSTAIQDNY